MRKTSSALFIRWAVVATIVLGFSTTSCLIQTDFEQVADSVADAGTSDIPGGNESNNDDAANNDDPGVPDDPDGDDGDADVREPGGDSKVEDTNQGCGCPDDLPSHVEGTSCTESGDCELACQSGYKNFDGNIDNGCECEVQKDSPDPTGEDENCDGVDGIVDNTVFVSESRGSEDASGKKPNQPVGTLTSALRVARQTDRSVVLIEKGTYSIPPEIEVANTEVFGGYTVEAEDEGLEWSRRIKGGEGARTTLKLGDEANTDPEVASTIRVRADKNLTWSGLQIIGPDVNTRRDNGVGTPSYGLVLIGPTDSDSDNDEADQSRDGGDRTDAESTESDGLPIVELAYSELFGGEAGSGRGYASSNDEEEGDAEVESRAEAGANGAPGSAIDGGDASASCDNPGGKGGQGNKCPGNAYGRSGEDGLPSDVADPSTEPMGGEGGLGGDPICNVDDLTDLGSAYHGEPGEDGTIGRGGAGGEQGNIGFGQLEKLTWRPDPNLFATGGKRGTAGAGGGGGGGGGGYSKSDPSPHGGGAGSGGCGGNGGKPGRPGGLVATVVASGVQLNMVNTTLYYGKSGDGGSGQHGGNGGDGGSGQDRPDNNEGTNGGDGGDGGGGGGGGGGAGGCSGPMVGIALENDSFIKYKFSEITTAEDRPSGRGRPGTAGKGGEAGQNGKTSARFRHEGRSAEKGCNGNTSPIYNFETDQRRQL